MLRTIKPKNARSKRALEAREAKEVEDPRTALFIKCTHTGEVLNRVLKDLMALKRPHVISFSKKNVVHPFEDASSLEFWATKNDASFFVIAQSTKKRPNDLVFVRTFDGRVLDMCEVGVDSFVSMNDFKTSKSTPGHKPLLHFASPLFNTHPRFQQLKSLLISLFNGEVVSSICLPGLEYVISVSLAPTPEELRTTGEEIEAEENVKALPKVHIRTYNVKLLASGARVPRVALEPMGPSLDLSLRRHQPADPEMLKKALQKPKLKKSDIEKGLGKKRKNLEVDEMGDLRGRIHVGKQDLVGLKGIRGRKMKGLRDREKSRSDKDEQRNKKRKLA